MKKLIAILFVTAVVAINLFARETAPVNRVKSAMQVQEAAMKDGLIFKVGKVWKINNGKSKVLEKEITLAHGIKVKPDGFVLMKDGAATNLREGDFISMDGMTERATPVKAADRKKAYPEKGADK